jgi:hypothetical protein
MKELSILQPINLINANDTMSVIKTQVRVKMTIKGDNGSHTEEISLYVGNIGSHGILLEMPWLLHHDPTIRWRAYNVTMDQCPDTCIQNQTTTITSAVTNKEEVKNRCITTAPAIALDTDNKDNQNQDNTIQAIMVARALFHEKYKGSVKDAPSVIKDHQDKLSKRQKIQNQHNIKLRAAKVEAQKASNTAQRLAQNSKKEDIPKTLEEMVPARYHHYLSVFDEKEANQFPSSKPWDHAIDLKDNFVPKDCKIYPLSPVERTLLNTWITEQLGKGYIRPSKSPQASPFFFVGKKDGKLRPVQDYWYLNTQTIKNAYPIPLISETVDKLKGAKYFSKADVQWGYNNIWIKDGDQWKAAFKTQRGLFKPTVMFFGLCNSPATFQSMMNHLFKDLINQNVVVVYMDDILIYTKDLEEHRKVTEEVLRILKDNDLYLKPEKCEFEQTKIEYLGLIISENHVKMVKVKVQGVLDWPTPQKVKDVQAFLGFANFYQRFVEISLRQHNL